MNIFFIEFRDPLFGIIVFFALVFMITLFSYWWGRYKAQEDSKQLDKFLKGFRTAPTQNELKVLISSGELSEKSWLILANSYFKNGEYEKSIEIYHELLALKKTSNQKETLFLLGQTYFKAGFLERAKEVLLEILKKNPRTPQALTSLLLIYENMKRYDLALDVLEPLIELDQDVSIERIYINFLLIFDDYKISTDEKVKKILGLYKEDSYLTYMVFQYLFRIDAKLAWLNLDIQKADLIVDILWQLDKKDLDLDIISTSNYLKELYSARGDVALATKSSIFELDVLINLDKKVNATLGFEYVCSKCNWSSPFAFHRCTKCNSIDTLKIDINLIKNFSIDFDMQNDSFV